MIAADRIDPAIATPALVDADTTNVERICVIGLPALCLAPRFVLRSLQRADF